MLPSSSGPALPRCVEVKLRNQERMGNASTGTCRNVLLVKLTGMQGELLASVCVHVSDIFQGAVYIRCMINDLLHMLWKFEVWTFKNIPDHFNFIRLNLRPGNLPISTLSITLCQFHVRHQDLLLVREDFSYTISTIWASLALHNKVHLFTTNPLYI